MLVGESRLFGLNITVPAASSADLTSPTLAIIKPDGTAYTPTPVVTDTPSGTSTAFALSLAAAVSLSQAGIYYLDWQYTLGAPYSGIYIAKEQYFAAWTDIYRYIRTEMLANNVTTGPLVVSDADIDFVLSHIIRAIYASGYRSILPVYWALIGDDRRFMDEAIAYLAVIRLRRSKFDKAPEGELVMYRHQEVEYRFSPMTKPGASKSRDDMYFDNAMNAFGRITSIAALYNAKVQRFHIFTVAGPSRKRQTTYGQSQFSNAASLLSDAINFTVF